MKTISFYFPLRTDITNNMILIFKELSEEYKKSLNINYIDSNNSITDAIKYSGELLVTIEITDNILKKFGNNCIVFSKSENDIVDDFSSKFKSDINNAIDILHKDTVYTNNDNTNAFYLVFDYDWISQFEQRNPKKIIDLLFESVIKYFNIKKDAELNKSDNFTVKVYRTGEIINTTDLDLAIAIANKKPSSVVLDLLGNVLHKSSSTKVVIGRTYDKTVNPFTKPSIPNHIINTSDQNKF